MLNSTWRMPAAALLAVATTACTGSIGAGTDTAGPGSPGRTGSSSAPGRTQGGPGASGGPGSSTPGSPGTPGAGQPGAGGIAIPGGAPGPTALRRLTNEEYRNTLQDLLGLSAPPADPLEPETSALGYNDFASALTVSGTIASQYATLAGHVAAAVNVTALAPCASAAMEATCANTFISGFGKRAHRRPLTAAEAQSYRAIYDAARTTGTFADGIKLVIETMLQSPYLLYRFEYGTSGAKRTLTPYEVASELSYMFLASMPDAELMAAADANALGTTAQVEAQARRLMKPPRAKGAIRRFVNQWLAVDSITATQKNTTKFPMFDDKMKNAMLAESSRFVDSVLWEKDGTVKTLLTAPFTFINSTLAPLYGVPDPGKGDTLVMTNLDPRQRAGILTQPAVMSVESKQDDSFPIVRGKFVRLRMLCQTLPPPPKDVVITPPNPSPNLTTRERFAQHSASPACSSCHSLIDPVGFGLENFDAIGRYRTTENGRPVDSSGVLSGTDVDGPYTGSVELAGKLASSSLVRQCAALQAARWAYGRPEIETDKMLAKTLDGQLGAAGMDLREVLVSIVKSESFLTRTFAP